MGKALYRQYRSRSFESVVGQSHVTDLLRAAVERGTISHAYLFTGPRGVGKTSVARILAHAINNLPYDDDSTHLDIIEIDAASNRRIDDIRDLREKVHIAPTSARYKVYIIDEVHMLTGESFNALLKTLEEPPEHAVFILATTELHKVPATIVSRTQRFHFRPGTASDVGAHLRTIADQESIAIDDDALALIAEHSEGGFRDSVSLLDQVSHLTQETITRRHIEDLLGLAPHESIAEICSSLASGAVQDAIARTITLLDDGTSPVIVTDQLLRQLPAHASTSPQLYPLLHVLLEVPRSYAPHLKLVAAIADLLPRPPVASSSPDSQPLPTSSPLASKPKPRAQTPARSQKTEVPKAKEEVAMIDTGTTEAIDWKAILSDVQSRAPALHSVLKRAHVEIASDRLTMSFDFALHRKKMLDPKYQQQLAGVIAARYGSSPEIIIESGKQPLSSAAADVANLMGGGEAVTVKDAP